MTPLESQILTGAVLEMQRHGALTPTEINAGLDRHERAKLRIAHQCATDNVVRLNVRDWSTEDVQSGAGRVRVTRALKKLESRGYVERVELYIDSGRTCFIRITPAGLKLVSELTPPRRRPRHT